MSHKDPTQTSENKFAKAQSKLSGEVFGALVNLSGRRRFTSQRAVLYAVLASMGRDDAIAVSREALTMLHDAHTALMEGIGGLPGIFCGQLDDAYFGGLQGDLLIKEFLALATSTLAAIEAREDQAATLLDKLVASSTPLLVVLNTLTLVYEEQSKRHALTSKRQLLGMVTDIQAIARQARMAAFEAQVVAARAGDAGTEFSSVASILSNVTGQIDDLAQKALKGSANI